MRQRRFAVEYLVDFNATRAARRAGYSPRTAYSQGSRLLKIVEVQGALGEGTADMRERARVTQEDVLNALLDTHRLAVKNGNYGAAVRALELFGKHLGMWDGQGARQSEAPVRLPPAFSPEQLSEAVDILREAGALPPAKSRTPSLGGTEKTADPVSSDRR